MGDDRQKLTNSEIIEIWSKIVDVQQHFNEIAMKIRSLFVTLVLALFAAWGFLLENGNVFEFLSISVSFHLFIPLIGMLCSWLFYFVDRHWYHRLLVGSIKQGIFIEETYKKTIPEISLGAAISKESPVTLTGGLSKLVAGIVVSDSKFIKDKKLHSNGKIEFFYKSIWLVFLSLFLLMIFFSGIRIGQANLAEYFVSLFNCQSTNP